MDDLTALPTWLLVVLGALVVIQVSVEVWALVVLFRTPEERLQTGKRWPWALIILFVNLIGAIVFFVAGRKPVTVADPLASTAPGASAGDRAQRAANVLYGPEGDDER